MKTVLITGATSGIGRETALALAKRGAATSVYLASAPEAETSPGATSRRPDGVTRDRRRGRGGMNTPNPTAGDRTPQSAERRMVSVCSARPNGPTVSCRTVEVSPMPSEPKLTEFCTPNHSPVGSRYR
jgi:NAD(P)-dependent dehydrogenase (short-subunit alcohol dehydrogenase family)